MDLLVLLIIRTLGWCFRAISYRFFPKHFVFQCPTCKSPQLCKERTALIRRGAGAASQTSSFERAFQCGKCHEAFPAEEFQADTTGVYQIKRWDCPQCGAINPNSTFQCIKCKYSLV